MKDFYNTLRLDKLGHDLLVDTDDLFPKTCIQDSSAICVNEKQLSSNFTYLVPIFIIIK
jgi:hypothetical protein